MLVLQIIVCFLLQENNNKTPKQKNVHINSTRDGSRVIELSKCEENARDVWLGLPYQRFVRNADAPRRRGCFGVSRNQTKMPAHSAY
jgi:hypothetical protein